MTFVADVRTAQIADLVVIQDNSVADGAMANTLRMRVTDAFGNTLAGQTVSVMAGNSATVAPTVTTEPDGTVEISVTSQTAGISIVTASINNSSLSRDVTFVADVRTAKIADLVVIKDGSEADGSTANTLQVRVTDAFGNALAGQTVSVLARQRRNGRPDGHHSSRTVRWRSLLPARRRESVQSLQPSTAVAQSQERDIYRRCQDGEDRGSGGH